MREILDNMAATIKAPISEPKHENVIKSISSSIEVPATLRNRLRFLKNINHFLHSCVAEEICSAGPVVENFHLLFDLSLTARKNN